MCYIMESDTVEVSGCEYKIMISFNSIYGWYVHYEMAVIQGCNNDEQPFDIIVCSKHLDITYDDELIFTAGPKSYTVRNNVVTTFFGVYIKIINQLDELEQDEK